MLLASLNQIRPKVSRDIYFDLSRLVGLATTVFLLKGVPTHSSPFLWSGGLAPSAIGCIYSSGSLVPSDRLSKQTSKPARSCSKILRVKPLDSFFGEPIIGSVEAHYDFPLDFRNGAVEAIKES